MKRYRSCLTASVCLGLLTALSACDDDHGGYYPPPPVVPTGDGAGPDALIQGQDGNFYGTTVSGGLHGLGTVFKISTNDVMATLYSFTGGNDGANPYAGLVQGIDSNFYGTTCGTDPGYVGFGTVFKISVDGVLTTLYSFTGHNDGAIPQAGGNLWRRS